MAMHVHLDRVVVRKENARQLGEKTGCPESFRLIFSGKLAIKIGKKARWRKPFFNSRLEKLFEIIQILVKGFLQPGQGEEGGSQADCSDRQGAGLQAG